MGIDEKTALEIENYNQQLQQVLIQKETLKSQLLRNEKALNELKNSTENNCFVLFGNVMISKSREQVIKELEEENEIIQIKIKSLENTENKIKEKLKEIESKLAKS